MAARIYSTVAVRWVVENKTTLILGVVWLIVAAGLLAYLFFSPSPTKVQWHTETEQNTAGFYIYRSTNPEGEFELITEEIIPSEGSAITGASYSFSDETAVSGETYYYLLEEIEYDGTINRYSDNIISQRVPVNLNGWTIALVALITLVGIGLMISGIRDGR